MVFSSQIFVFIFLPVVFVLNVLVSRLKKPLGIRLSNGLLLAASLVFYTWGEPVLVLLPTAMTLGCFFLCLLMDSKTGRENKKVRKLALVLTCVFCLGCLCFFKYSDFFVNTIADITTLEFLKKFSPNVTLPLGISFYSFQLLSYCIDVYNGKVKACRNFFRVFMYVLLFPQLVAGPIVKYADVADAINDRSLNAPECADGLKRFIVGLAKKMIIANNVALIADSAFALSGEALTGAAARIGAISYVLQIYFDFSGYSDMAIGMGHMFGFKFNENFNYPYSSTTVKEFWRRWHISVSSWFKEYLYIPLGGNRRGRFRTCVNKIIVFFFTGLWHGASFTFILWGLWHGMFLLIEEYAAPVFKKISMPKILGKIMGFIYTMLVVTFGFVLFRSDSVKYALEFSKKMVTDFGSVKFGTVGQTLSPFVIFTVVLGMVFAFPIGRKFSRLSEKYFSVKILSYALAIVLFLICGVFLAQSSYNPFIYFRF